MLLKLKCSCSNLKVKITVKHMLMQYFSQWRFLANRAAFFHATWGAAQALGKKKICAAKRFSIIYHITLWGIGKLVSLLAEKVPCTEAV